MKNKKQKQDNTIRVATNDSPHKFVDTVETHLRGEAPPPKKLTIFIIKPLSCLGFTQKLNVTESDICRYDSFLTVRVVNQLITIPWSNIECITENL